MSLQKARAQSYKDQFTFTEDNDQYVNPSHDRYYTDGTVFNFTHALNRPKVRDSSLVKKILEFEFGQRIYNSYSADARHIYNGDLVFKPYFEDRPFTAYLFAGASMNWLYANESALKFNAEIGTIGPAALGQQIQAGFHKLFGLYPARGWDYQLKNAPGINLKLDYKMLLYRTPGNWFDVAFNPDGWLGNTFTGADVGLQLRIGNLGSFTQSASTNSRVSSNSNEQQKQEFYFFTQPQFNYVAYDATIEGGLFLSDKGPLTFGIYHYVYQQEFGLQFSSARWSANYTAYIRSREVKSTALGDQWGSINLAYRW